MVAFCISGSLGIGGDLCILGHMVLVVACCPDHNQALDGSSGFFVRKVVELPYCLKIGQGIVGAYKKVGVDG